MWIALYDIITLQGVVSNTERFVRFAHKELSQKKTILSPKGTLRF